MLESPELRKPIKIVVSATESTTTGAGMLDYGLLGMVSDSRVGSCRDISCILVISENEILKLTQSDEFAADFLFEFALCSRIN